MENNLPQPRLAQPDSGQPTQPIINSEAQPAPGFEFANNSTQQALNSVQTPTNNQAPRPAHETKSAQAQTEITRNAVGLPQVTDDSELSRVIAEINQTNNSDNLAEVA